MSEWLPGCFSDPPAGEPDPYLRERHVGGARHRRSLVEVVPVLRLGRKRFLNGSERRRPSRPGAAVLDCDPAPTKCFQSGLADCCMLLNPEPGVHSPEGIGHSLRDVDGTANVGREDREWVDRHAVAIDCDIAGVSHLSEPTGQFCQRWETRGRSKRAAFIPFGDPYATLGSTCESTTVKLTLPSCQA